MKNKKHIYTLLIFLVLMLSISAVCAAEDTTSNISSVEDNEEIILEATPTENNLNDANELILEESPNKETLNIENENEILTADGSFTDLNSLINDNTDTEISLDRNYTYSSGDNFANGITINREVTTYEE